MPNGKLNRKALPAPRRKGTYAGPEERAPRSAVQRQLASIWTEVLGLERVGIHDNFFELGGHSLSATRVVSQVRSVLQVELPVRSLFDTPTIAGLAETIEAAGGKPDKALVPPLQPVLRQGDLPLSFAQQRLWFLAQLDPDSAAYNLPYALRLRGRLDQDVLMRSLQEIVRRHEVLRTVFESREAAPDPGGPSAGGVLSEGRRSPRAGGRRAPAALRGRVAAEAARPFDLRQDLPLRVVLAAPGRRGVRWPGDAASHCLRRLVNGSVLAETATLYSAYAKGQTSPLPELTLQYPDFAIWQRAWLQDETLQRQLDYWRAQLRGLTPLELPSDRPRPPQQSYRGARSRLYPACESRGASPPTLPRRERDFAHDFASCLPDVAFPIQRAGGRCRWHADSGPLTCRGRATHRILREHLGRPHGPLGPAHFPGVAGPRADRRRWMLTNTRTCPSRSWWKN